MEDNHPSSPEVSIIIPLYNCGKYLAETLDSVLSQTFSNWEALLVDDKSTDDTLEIAREYERRDARFRVFEQPENMGAAKARNKALVESRGRFVAYLDSDDLWMPEKIEAQMKFMLDGGFGGCFTSYETVNEDGSHRNYIHVDELVDYKHFLKKPPTCSHTIMFDTDIVKREWLVMPDLRKRQDAATWLNVLKHEKYLVGLDIILAKNRKRADSLSANKFSAVQNTWRLYTQVERLPKPYAAYCLGWQMFHAVLKRIGRH
ncbi:MAG: glycosyl transferase family 2 [Methanosphaera sp. rholeuAM270]|nr:MAG: glycosyl transferase family 2 [Methanosphaera sp. rholeuAM270]